MPGKLLTLTCTLAFCSYALVILNIASKTVPSLISCGKTEICRCSLYVLNLDFWLLSSFLSRFFFSSCFFLCSNFCLCSNFWLCSSFIHFRYFFCFLLNSNYFTSNLFCLLFTFTIYNF